MKNKVISQKNVDSKWLNSLIQSGLSLVLSWYKKSEEKKSVKTFESLEEELPSIIKAIASTFSSPLTDSIHFFRNKIEISIDGKSRIITINQKLAMGVLDGQWSYGDDKKIQTDVTVAEGMVTIVRQQKEVVPLPSMFGPTPSTERFLHAKIESIYVEPKKTLNQRITNILFPIIHENMMAQTENQVLNNSDADSD
jgi:hypothetical protein